MQGSDYDREAFLTSTGNGIEAQIIETLLNSNGIPVMKKYREAGDYLKIYMGGTNFGVDLYVPSKLLEKAKEIINSDHKFLETEQPEGIDESEASKLEAKYIKKRQIMIWLMLLIPIIGILWVLLAKIFLED